MCEIIKNFVLPDKSVASTPQKYERPSPRLRTEHRR